MATIVFDGREAHQQPAYPDPLAVKEVTAELLGLPGLVYIHEIEALLQQFAVVAGGGGFVLVGGDCAEAFRTPEATIRATVRLLLQMKAVIQHGSSLPVVLGARAAGQFTKPRSNDMDGSLPSYRGDGVCGFEPTLEARTPDPQRMLQMYHESTAVMNLLRALMGGGFASLHEVMTWSADFAAGSPEGAAYRETAREILRTLEFMRACGVDVNNESAFGSAKLFATHEGLLMPYELGLLRRAEDGRLFAASGHMLWLGERTRQLDGAHVELFSKIYGPIGVKLGPTATPDDALDLCERLNPDNIPGRLTFKIRMGSDKIRTCLPPIQAKARAEGRSIVWMIDPMHGNTIEASNGYKTRHFDRITDEVAGFFEACAESGVHAGGIHVELTGLDVTECLGGREPVEVHHLGERYETRCDPRLNTEQALELSYLVSEMLRA